MERASPAGASRDPAQVTSDLVEAIRLTKQAHDLDPDPLYLCNVGGFYRMLEDWARADSYLGRCLQLLAASRPDEVARFRGVLDDVERRVATDHVPVLIEVRPWAAMVAVSTFASDEIMPAPALVWLPVGVHRISASVPGHGVRERTVQITPAMLAHHSRKIVAIDLDRRDAVGGHASARRLFGWTAVVAGAVAAASFGLGAGGAADDHAANVTGGVLTGIAVAASVGWLYERGRDRERAPMVSFSPLAHGGIVTVGVRR